MTVSNITTTNTATIKEWSTGDLTALTGYDADTYYTYTITYGGNDARLWGIYVEAGAASGCSSYSFHYGNDGAPAAEWTTECFVAKGDDHEMQIEDFTIPSKTHFYVGKNGSFSGTSGNASDANSVTSLWSAMYFATSIGDGTGTRPMVGQATGATGTIRIYDNSTWNNKQAAFIPDGYKLKVGSTEYAMAVHGGNEYRSDIVEMSSSNARDLVSVGITNNSGNYVGTANSEGMQHIFLNTGGTTYWSKDGVNNFGLYDITNSRFACLMTKVPGEDYLYEGWVPENCTKVIFVRLKSSTLAWGDGNSNVHNKTGDLSLLADNNLFTISSWSDGSWSAYEKKGKFRMNADWTDKNWYVRFYPYHVLHYDANGGTGEPADQSVAADASPCQLTVSSTEPTRTDYVFQGWNPTKATADAGTIDGAWDPGDTHTMTGDVTLYAVWEACSGPTISANDRTGIVDGAHEVGDELGTASVTATAGNGGTLSYKWYYYDDSPGKPVDPNDYTAAPGTNNQATYQIPSSSTCTARHYFCVVSEEGCSTTVEGIPTGALTLTEPVDPCSEPAEVTNEIARFFVPCGLSNATSGDPSAWEVTQDASTEDNTFTTNDFGGSGTNWYRNETSGLIYGKLTGNSGYIQLKLKSGSFQAGDVVTAYFNANNGTKTGLKLKSTEGNGNEPSATAKEVETSSTYTLVAADIETDGSIKLFRAGSATYVNRIIVTRAPVAASVTATLLTPAYMPTGASGVQIGVEITGASTGWKYRVKNGSDGYEGPDNTAYTTTTWTMTSTIGAGANTYVVELYDGTGTKQATSNTITVTGETTYPVTITAGANGTVSPSGVVQANGSHIKPEITATPNTGYRFVNWTLSNSNATLADASSATTTITNAIGACEITANFAAATLTAIEANTLYQAQDMANVTFTTNTWFAGLSTNNKFKTYGDGTSTSAKGTSISSTSISDDIGSESFTSKLYIMEADNTSSSSDPTKGAIEFITPSTAGTLYIYLEQNDSKLSIKKKGASSSTSLSGGNYKKINVEANTHYFINGSDTKRGLYGIKFIPAATYTVTYNGSSAGGGTVPVDASSPYTSGSTVTVLGNTGSLTRTISDDAATFYGWNTNSNMYGGTHYNAGETFTMPSSDVTLYAVWGYTITWNLNDGDWVDYTAPTYYIYGQGLTLPTEAKISKSGYTFDHWELAYNNSTITAIADDATGNVTLNAIWTAAASSYSVTYNGNDNTGGSVPTDATSYSAGDIVTVKGNTGSLVKTGQTFLGWSTSATASSGTFYPAGYKFEMPASNVTLYAVWGSAAEEKYYYGSISITASALTPGSTGGHKGFFTSNSGVIASSNAISLSNTPSETKYYYESSTLTHTELNKSSNWNASSTAKRTIRAFKFASGTTYTLALGSKVATSIMFYGKCGSKSKTMTVGDQEYESPSTKETFFSHEFTKSGNFTGNVAITQNGDFYGILVITISTGAASNFTVSFNMNGHGSAIDAIANVPSGSMIGEPIPDPTAVDWEFGGWHNEAGCTSAFDFANTTITADKTLYAKWTNCAPTVTTQPVAASYAQNATATALTVAANDNGGGELHYQWWVKENDLDEETGSAIPGETGTSFTPSTELLGTSYYYCVVSNDCGNVFSNTAGITITDARPNPKAVWDVAVPTHGGKGFSFSVEVNKNDDSNWDGTLTADMLSVSSEAVLGTVTVDNTTKTIRGTYGVKGSATSPVTFYLLLPATASQAAARLDHDQSFTECVGGSGDSYDIRVRKTTTKDGNYYHWANTDGWISQKIASSFSSEKASTKMGESEQFDSIYNTNAQYVWVRTYHANINKVRIYADFRANDMTVSNVYKHTDYFSEASKYIVGYTAVYNDDSDAANLGDAAQGYVDITLEEPMNANDIVLVKFNDAKVRTLGAVLTEGRSGGSLETSLVWSNSQDNGATLEKREDAVDFTITANRGGTYSDNANASLGTISYSSSNTSVATVNAATGQVTIADNIDFGSTDYKTTTITATLAASGCYKRCVLTYVLQVNKYVCTEAVGTVSIQTDNGCSGKVLAVSGYEAGAAIQWYKDGEVIPSATNATTYNATEGGTYYVVTHGECDAVSNEIKISFGTATATKIVDEWYVKNGRRTPDIALVQTENATSFTVTSGGSPIDNIGGCKFYLGTDGIIYLKGQQDDGTEPSGLTAGEETITITASACEAASGLDIVIHKQEQRGDGKPEIAFVVDGTLRKDGGTATSVLASKTSERPIWTFLSTYYSLTGCNAYWSVNSKELRQYYSQFDAILITDDPNTSTEGTGGVSYVKAFGTMVDVRPVLTMEAYVGKFKDGGWHVYNATPSSPNPRQVEMKLECKNHDIFVGLNPSTMDNVRTETINGDEYWFVTMVDTTQSPYHNTKDDYEALPALQGFDKTKFSNMLGVGTIKNDELQAGVERQEEPAARMMILGIQNNAMAALTTEGKMVVKNALDYLLKTDMEDVNDCANYFLGTTNNQWNVASNWSRNEVPDFETRARILRPVVVPNDYSARVARVDIASDGPSKKLSGAECTGSLTISQLGALVVSGKVSRVHAPYYGVNDLMPTEVSDVAILSGTGGNGTLIMDDASGENKAYVQMYSKAVKGSPTTWQYIGIPHSDVGNAMDNYYDSWLYSWNPSNGWEVVLRGAAVTPWTGYCITYPTFGHKYEMTGTLVATADVDIDVPANSYQIIGNSWVAPIQIANFEDEDFGDIPKTVYFFNTGSDTGGSGAVSGNATGETRWAAGTYVAVPIHMAEYTGEDKIIPSMQGFYVANTGSAGTLHLDYDKLVRQHGVSNYIQGQMHAPRRIAKGSNDPVMLKMIVRGSRYDDRLIVAEREDFTKGHDDGWDGAKWDGSTISPTIWSQNDEGGVESVTATPDMEGTIIGFRAGEDNEYTFHFEYDDMAEPLFLLDMDERMYVRILNDVTYTFTCADKGEHNRFLLTRKAPGIPTGCEPIDGGGGPKAMKFIKDNKLYILLNGVLYDATGKVVE
ncbi:MAG: InlB B-repeat-containing protein [Paludibacteraceae bacterium]|nr:InlB B-repeat-containing protein [Paludibacteraceae bacterium]